MTLPRSSAHAAPETAADTRRAQILAAGRAAFAEGGLEGARVDDIARRAAVNKQLVYHYFGSKEGLYTTVLRDVYADLRASEAMLKLETLSAKAAMRRLIEFSFDYLAENREFVRIVADENAHDGRHLASLEGMEDLNRPIVDSIRATLERGVGEGAFQPNLDPLQLYLSIAGMAFFYFSNLHTLSRAFSRELDTRRALRERREAIVTFTLNAVRAH